MHIGKKTLRESRVVYNIEVISWRVEASGVKQHTRKRDDKARGHFYPLGMITGDEGDSHPLPLLASF